MTNTLYLNKEQLELSHQQLVMLEHLYHKKLGDQLPTIYAITPTYQRWVQKAELTRLSQTLALVPNIHWIIVEDAEEKSDLVANVIIDSNVVATHLSARTPEAQKLHMKVSTYI